MFIYDYEINNYEFIIRFAAEDRELMLLAITVEVSSGEYLALSMGQVILIKC